MKDGLLKQALMPLILTRRRVRYYSERLQHLGRQIGDHEYGNCVISDAVRSGTPQAIGKIGFTELDCLRMSIAVRGNSNALSITAVLRKQLYNNAGVFPDDYQSFSRWGQLLEDVLPEMTVMGVYCNSGEASIIKRYCANAQRVRASSVDALYYGASAWTSALAGRKVLVALPFERTVRQQYARREHLYPSKPWILPEFRLDTLKVFPHAHLVKPVHRDWFEALEAMQREMDKRDFDVLLIGAGAYSIPLAVHAKRLGKQGIHVGGGAQFLFGIKGRRWDASSGLGYYNEYWSRPLPEETPPGIERIEGGCYW